MESTFETLERQGKQPEYMTAYMANENSSNTASWSSQPTVESLVSIMKDWIPPGTVIISDCWESHSTL
jgi:hypothetical protein